MVVMHDNIISGAAVSETVLETMSPKTFIQALRDKYTDQEEFDNRLMLPKDRIISTQITLVGFGTVSSIQKQLKRLASIDLSNRHITTAGELHELDGNLNQVQILNLSDNLLPWQEVNRIVTCLPRLQELILTKNRLTSNEPAERLIHTHTSLKSLIIGRVFLDWSTIVSTLSQIWNQVEQLDIWDNHLCAENMELENLEEFSQFVRQIRILKLSYNKFPNLDWINRMGPVKNLTELDISNCRLQSIDMNTELAQLLQNLQSLNVSFNDINDWISISSLHNLRNLKSLICHENPIYLREKFAKSLTIGRLGQIKVLNREEIDRSTRTDSEILYLRKAFPEYQLFTANKNDNFKNDHPRFEELVNIYGVPEDLTRKQTVDKYITVNLCHNDEKIVKKLPCDMRIANVQMLCKRLFKLRPSSTIEITCHGTEIADNVLSYVLDKEGQSLDFFSVKTGYTLLIKELNC